MSQISLTLPEKLLQESTRLADDQGYRSVQELILETLRRRVSQEKRYERILKELKAGKGTRMTAEETKAWLAGLADS